MGLARHLACHSVEHLVNELLLQRFVRTPRPPRLFVLNVNSSTPRVSGPAGTPASPNFDLTPKIETISLIPDEKYPIPYDSEYSILLGAPNNFDLTPRQGGWRTICHLGHHGVEHLIDGLLLEGFVGEVDAELLERVVLERLSSSWVWEQRCVDCLETWWGCLAVRGHSTRKSRKPFGIPSLIPCYRD